MEVIPAIDIRGGRCVRLKQGNYVKESVFYDKPEYAAAKWESAGATRLHVVDLDGARDGKRINQQSIRRIFNVVHAKVQVGGGIRSAEDAVRLVDEGADRVIFGTSAVENPSEVEKAVTQLGAEHVAVSADVRKGLVASRGWEKDTSIEVKAFIRDMTFLGIIRFIYTDILRDGALEHPNFAEIEPVLAETRYPIIIAGGITSLDDIQRLALAGAEGVITGMALYAGGLDLKTAIMEADKAI